MHERDLQATCIDWYEGTFAGALVLNVHGGGWTAKGFPDLVGCLDGRFWAVELKVPGGRMSAAQRIWSKRIVAAGGSWACVDTFEGFRYCMEGVQHDAGIRRPFRPR